MKVLPILGRAWPLFVVFLLMLPTLGYPMSWDQGVYAYVGQGILEGHPPYRDAWAQNAPGNFFAYAAALRLFGETAWSIGMLGLMEVVAGAGAVMLAAHQLLGQRYVAAAGLSFGITMALWGGYWDRAHPESLMAIGVTLVVVAVTTAQRKPRWALPAWAFAGVLTACCVVLKPTGAVVGVLALGMPLVLTRGKAALPRAGWLVAFGLGALAPIAAVAAYLNLTGSIEYFREQVLEYNLHYVGAGFGQDLFASITSLTNQTVLLAGPVPVLAAMGARTAWTRQAGDPAVRLLFLWAGLTYLGVAVQSSHYGYHQYFTLPAFSLLAAFAIVHWRNFVPRRRSLLYLACLATALYAGFEAAVAGPRLRTFGAGLSESFGVPVEGDFLGRQGLGTRQSVGFYLQQMTSSEEMIFVVGESLIYFEARRRAPTALFQELPFRYASDPQRMAGRLAKDLAVAPPRYIVVHHQPEDFFFREQTALLKAIEPFLSARYIPDRAIERYQLYRLKDG